MWVTLRRRGMQKQRKLQSNVERVSYLFLNRLRAYNAFFQNECDIRLTDRLK